MSGRSDVQVIAEALAGVLTPTRMPSEYWADQVLTALASAGRVVVDRDDLAWALSEIEDCYRGQPKPIPYHEYDRLRSVLTEGGTDAEIS